MSKYTLEYLKSLLDKENAKLVGDYEKLNVFTPIEFICNCGNTHTKKFIVLKKHHANCTIC